MKQLQQIYDDLSTLTDEDLVLDYSDKLTTINDTFNDNTSDEEFDLMNLCEDMLEIAKDHFENIHRQEELDQELDERKYANSHHLS
jgi:hypothetical protein